MWLGKGRGHEKMRQQENEDGRRNTGRERDERKEERRGIAYETERRGNEEKGRGKGMRRGNRYKRKALRRSGKKR